MQSIQQRLEETKARYERRQEVRDRREDNLKRLGEDGDWREVDDPVRVLRYARARGLGEEAELALEASIRAAPAHPDARAPIGGAPPALDVLERIIGDDDLLAARFLDGGAAVARSVGRVVLRSEFGAVLGHGTGFLVSPGALMTNNHVFQRASDAQHSVVQFDYRDLPDGRTTEPTVFALRPDLLFETDEDLDVTVVALADASSSGEPKGQRGWSPLSGATGKAIVNARVNLVQHPAGDPQRLALRDNRIVDVFEKFLHYRSDTKRGSSGAPVFNDQWQLAALHHSGVPEKDDAGHILLVNGDRWDGSDAQVPMISWVANEGVRISSIVAHLKKVAEHRTGTARHLLDEVLTAEKPPVNGNESHPSSTPDDRRGSGPRVGPDGRVHWTVPLEISAALGVGAPAPVVSVSAPPQGPIDSPERPAVDPESMQRALHRLKETETWTYYDETEDAAARDEYYAHVEEGLSKARLYDALRDLLTETHAEELSYRSARLDHLYPWIDLREDPRELRSIYSGDNFSPEEVIRQELEVEAFRARRIREFRVREASFDEEAFAEFLDDLEASSPFNCEHVVPQSWFAKKMPMKTDLHHLFTCEWGCNSFRSNIPYYEFSPEDEKVREKCGERVADKFEPAAGKGAVARATLYFLLRYPHKVGDSASEMRADRLGILLGWHEQEPPDAWEFHRNAEIAKVQGNRNPLIDFPDWGRAIDFKRGFA